MCAYDAVYRRIIYVDKSRQIQIKGESEDKLLCCAGWMDRTRWMRFPDTRAALGDSFLRIAIVAGKASISSFQQHSGTNKVVYN